MWIKVPRLGKLPEPTSLEALKREVVRRWGVVDLLDALKEVDWLTGFTEELTTVASTGRARPDCGAPARPTSPARTSARAIIRVLNATFAERDPHRGATPPPWPATRSASAHGTPSS